MLRVKLDDLETADYDIYFEATYKGVPFTGIAIDDDRGIHSECEYKEGFAHGRWSTTDSNGRLIEEIILDMGKEISNKVWDIDGNLTYEFIASPLSKRQYFENGDLKYDEDENGYIMYSRSNSILRKYIYIDSFETIFSPNGEWLVKHHSSKENLLIMSLEYLEFNDEALIKYWKQWLIDNVHVEVYPNGYPDIYPYFIQWIDSLLLRKQVDMVDNIVIEMINMDEPAIKYDGITLAMRHKVKNAIPYIIGEKDNTIKPLGYANKGYGFTVGQIARMSIKEIQNS